MSDRASVDPRLGLVGVIYLAMFAGLFARSAGRDDMVGAFVAMVALGFATVPAIGLVPRQLGKPPVWMLLAGGALLLAASLFGTPLVGLLLAPVALFAHRLSNADLRTITAWRLVATAVCGLLVVPLLLLLAPGLFLRT